MLLTSQKWRCVVEETFSNTDALFEALLKTRGIVTPQEREDFLTEKGAQLYDPFLFNDMKKAVDLICDAISQNKKILVYGDYDCDGVTATSILVRYFRSSDFRSYPYPINSSTALSMLLPELITESTKIIRLPRSWSAFRSKKSGELLSS